MAKNPLPQSVVDYYSSLSSSLDRQRDALDDPVTRTLRQLNVDHVRDVAQNGGDAAAIARANVLARRIDDDPFNVDDDPNYAQKTADAQALGQVAQDHPAIGEHLANNPRTAMIAQGDHQSLGILGAAWQTLKDTYNPIMAFAAGLDEFDRQDTRRGPSTNPLYVLPMAVGAAAIGDQSAQSGLKRALPYTGSALASGVAGMYAGATGFGRMATDGIGWQGASDLLNSQRRNAEDYQKRTMPKTGDWITDQVLGGISNVPSTAVALGTSLTGRAVGLGVEGAALLGASSGGMVQGGQTYNEARDAGLSYGEASRYALLDTASEVAGEYVGEISFLKATEGGKSILTRFLRSQIGEQAGEQFSTIAQDFTKWAYMPENRNKPISAFFSQLPEDMAATAVQTLVAGGLSNLTIGGLEKAFDTRANKLRDETARNAHAMALADHDGAILSALARSAEQSQLRKLDPVAHEDMMRDLGEKAGTQTAYVPADAVVSYMQSDSYDQYTDPLARFSREIAEAAATGGDVALPFEFVASTMPGTKAWDALKDDIRFSEGGLSAREAESLRSDMGQKLNDVAAKIDQNEAKHEAARQKIVESVRTMLQDAGYTPDVANVHAELIATREATRAARMGRELTGNEFATQVQQVLPPALAAARKADATDLVINALRKGKPATVQQGDTLLEWIAKRGGLNDTGGDLKSMGLDTWHLRMPERGKKDKKGRPAKPIPISGRKKILRDFDPAQATMGGPSGAGDYGLDTVLRSAIEAGYFPELQGMANEDGVSDLDSQMLLDAIGEELAGSPRYAEEAKTDNIRAAAEELSQMLSERGLDPEGMSDEELRAAINQLDAEVFGDGLEQAKDGGPRGRILFQPNQAPLIQLFQSRNLSTLLHELSHQWLEELRADATSPDAPEQVKADWQAVQKWFADNGQAIGDDGAIPVEAHEMWARGGERYLMEGKAPSSGLSSLFERFRSWMLAIYKTVNDLRSPITPEIREVFDRLLATDVELTANRERLALDPMFKDAEAAGMSDGEFAAYTRQVEQARDKASGDLLAKTMAAIKRRETKRYNEERRAVAADETERLSQTPLFRALDLFKGSPVSKGWIVDRFGLDALGLLPKRVPPMYREGGAHPDLIAEEAGYASGQEMIEQLIGQEDAHRQAKEAGDKRTLRQRIIDRATDEEMARRYGDDPFNDGSIEREALEVLNGEKQGEVMAAELRILARSTGEKPTPYRIARQWARGKVRGGTVAQEASVGAVQRHARAVAKAGREAERALLKGDRQAAFRAKQQQMLSSALLAEAKEALDEVQAAQKRMAKVAAAKTMKSVDQDYLERAQDLLEAVDLRPRSQRSIDRQEKWSEWAKAREAEGYDVIVPDSYAGSLEGTHWTRLSVEKLLGLDEAVAQVMHLGRMKQALLDGKEEREFDAVASEAVAEAGNISGPVPKGLQEKAWWDSIKSGVLSMDASLLKIETILDWLDGGNPNGVFNRIVFLPIADAQARAQDMQKDYMGRIRDLLGALPSDQVSRWGDKVSTPFFDKFSNTPFTPARSRLIAMALNIGNEGNMQRLADGYGWNPDAIEAFLNETLTAEEWQFVQGVWDTIDTLWPELSALERRVNGVEPDKVEARSFVTPHGEMRGGYYPAIYDSTLSKTAEDRSASPDSALFEPMTTKATTRASSTKARSQKVSEPILLDIGVINRHISEVIHDLTHREAVMQAWKFLSNRRVSDAIDAALGRDIRQQLRPWVKFVANSWAMERAGNEGIGKIMTKARVNGTVVGMGMRVTTMMTQLAGYTNSIEVVGHRAFAKAMAQVARNPIATTRFVLQRSDEMRHRMDTLDRDLRTELAKLQNSNPLTKAGQMLIEGKQFFFHGIGWMDRVVTVPTWIAAYNAGLEQGMSEEDAAHAGDKAVRVSQGAGAPKDLAAIQRGTGKYGEALKLFTTFYSFFSALYQRQRTLARDMSGNDARRPRDFPRLLARTWWLYIGGTLATEALRGMAGGKAGPDDDEWWFQWTMRKLLANALGPIPFVRDAFEPMWNKAINNPVFSSASTPIQRATDALVKAAGDVGKKARGEDTKTATKDVLEAVGYVTGLVPGQIASSTQFLVDVNNGDQRPQDVREWIEGLSSGKIHEKK